MSLNKAKLIVWEPQADINFNIITSLLDRQGFKCEVAPDLDSITNDESIRLIVLLIFKSFRITTSQIECLDSLRSRGINILIGSNNCNVNLMINKYGICINDTNVIRANMYEYNHPKEAALNDFVADIGLSKIIQSLDNESVSEILDNSLKTDGLMMMYPFGKTLSINKPSGILLTSSEFAIPTRQPICAINKNAATRSNLLVLGSNLIFSDKYIQQDKNSLVIESLISITKSTNFSIEMELSSISKSEKVTQVPNFNHLLDIPIPSLPSNGKIPKMKSRLLEDNKLYDLDNSLVPQLNFARHLSLIKPVFKTANLELEPATYGPLLIGFQGPKLESLPPDC